MMTIDRRIRSIPTVLLMPMLALSGCALLGLDRAATSVPMGSSGEAPTGVPLDQHFPDVLAVELRPLGGRTYDVVVTMASPYDSPERYADGWRVLGADGIALGGHTLLHDHAAEQPFTRTQRGLRIPRGVTEVTVEGRDRRYGYGGRTVTVDVPE